MPAATPPPCREPSPNRQKIVEKSSKIDENRVPGHQKSMKIGSLGVPWATPGPHLAQISIFVVFAPILRRSWVPLGVHFGVVFGGFGDF